MHFHVVFIVDGPPPRRPYRHVKAKDVLDAFKWRELSKDFKDMLTVLRLKIMERDYKLINSPRYTLIKATLKQGDPDEAATKLIDYFEKNHDGDALLRFCEFLRDESKEAGGVAGLENLADKIERTVKAKGSSGIIALFVCQETIHTCMHAQPARTPPRECPYFFSPCNHTH